MRFTLFLVLLGIYFSLNVYGQKVPQSIECEEQTSSFLKSLNKQDFHASSILFRSLVSNCPEEEKNVLPNYLTFLKQQISGQKDIQAKSQLIDSLEKVYLRLEELRLYSSSEDIQRARYLFISPNANRHTIHRLIKHHLNEPQLLSESIIVQFYANLSALAKEEQSTQDTACFTQELFLIYPEISALCTQQNYSVKAHTTLQSYYEASFGSCKKCDNTFQTLLKQLPKNKDSLSRVLTEMSSSYEKMNCLASNTYRQIIDSLSRTGKTVVLELKKANHYKALQDLFSANTHLEVAKKLSTNQREIDSIQLEQCKNLLANKQYKEAYNACNKPRANFQGDFYIIAAQCLMTSQETCQESVLDFKLNAFLANEFLLKAKTLSTSIDSSLELKVKNSIPSDQDLKDLGIKHGQEITLHCWNQTFKIP